MPGPAEAAKNTVGKGHIIDQCLRIERQRELIVRLERDGHVELVLEAVRLLTEMEKALAQMDADYAAAREGLAHETAKVESDTPV